MMLARVRQGGELTGIDREEAQEAVLDYFAIQILQGASEDTRLVLVSTAFFPRITSMLVHKMSGIESGGRILEGLYRRHLFLKQRRGDHRYYQYHPLFQIFLRNEARRTLSPVAFEDLQRRSAQMLASEGLWSEAFDLYVHTQRGTEDWISAVALWIECAPVLIRQGRSRTRGGALRRLELAWAKRRLPTPGLPY